MAKHQKRFKAKKLQKWRMALQQVADLSGYHFKDGNNFTILPEFFKELQFLGSLNVSHCKHLQEIRGIPQNLRLFNARNCASLTSSSKSMLLNQELHEAGGTQFVFPGTRIPEWLDHQSSGHSSSFWFRNKFPPKLLCLLIAPVLEVAREKEWNHVEVRYQSVLDYEKQKRKEGVLDLESSFILKQLESIYSEKKAVWRKIFDLMIHISAALHQKAPPSYKP
ncbi:hypothetical protein glysoja_014118 [Glycine soja]|nr:hypothetical protein glysoja_014118 [Glycine soja]